MSGNLFICETPFQILASLLLIEDLREVCNNDFIIAGTMSDYKNYAQRLAQHPNVSYCYAAALRQSNRRDDRLAHIKDMVVPFDKRWDYVKKDTRYDKFYCRNFTTILTESAFRHFKRINSQLEVCIFDEGYSSYLSTFWNSYKEVSFFHKVSNIVLTGHLNYIYKNITETKFFIPELFHLRIPFKISQMIDPAFTLSNEQIERINRVFDYLNSDMIEDNKYIFFEECFSFDNGNNNDLEIIEVIADIVGKENVVIKLHPRSKEDRFSKLGYKVLMNVKYPWEIFALNNSNKSIVLLAFSSGALMNYLFITRSKMKSILLYKLFPGKYDHTNNLELRRWLKEFQKYYSKWIYAPETSEDLIDILKKLKLIPKKNCK